MNLYYIKSKVIIRVKGIAGPFEQVIPYLVNANNPDEAKSKYENQVRGSYNYMHPESFEFQYLEFAHEIK